MEVLDGFISGVFNYCDRWCERCALTSWCRLFADSARFDASRDPALKLVTDAPTLPQEAPPEPPLWMQARLEELNRLSVTVSDEDLRPRRPEFDRDDHPLLSRAHVYASDVNGWLAERQMEDDDATSPATVIKWYSTLVGAKIARALHGLAWDEPDLDPDERDYDGSAKVALIGLERSHAAWLALVERGDASANDVHPFIVDLMWITDALERLFPNARRFVRPAFDEPEAVARLLADHASR
jgi:hypothetical protein